MLLVADIGNSETVLGLRSDDGKILRRWRMRSDVRRTPDETGALLRSLIDGLPDGGQSLEALCFASVVPPLKAVFSEVAGAYLGIPACEFRYSTKLGISLEVDEPEQVGADRIANTLAAHLAYPGPAIIIDFGTATNFDVVSESGAFLGGVIAPGLEASASTLISSAALLPRIAPGFPDSFIGKSTVTNMQIGVYHGATVLIDGMVERIRAEWEVDAQVIATGGQAQLIGAHCQTVGTIDPNLTLAGVGWGYERLFGRSV